MELERVSKRCGDIQVIETVSVAVPEGQIIGLVGANGVGKTTLLKLLAGFLHPDEGRIRMEPGKISYLLREQDMYAWMKVKDAVCYYADFYPDFRMEQAISLLEEAGIELHRKVKRLSDGNKQRLCLILAVSRQVPYYLLDEPVKSTDPNFKKDFKKYLLRNLPENATVILATHLLKDLETLFDTVLVMGNRRIKMIEAEQIRENYNISVGEYCAREMNTMNA